MQVNGVALLASCPLLNPSPTTRSQIPMRVMESPLGVPRECLTPQVHRNGCAGKAERLIWLLEVTVK